MSRKISLPKIDPRQASDLLRQLRGMAPHYTKEWPAKDDDDPGVALLKIFSLIAEGVISRYNRAPERNFLAFLDMLGIRLLPATPAHAPVQFRVAKGTVDSFMVLRGTQVSAAATETRETELPFETIEPLRVIPAKMTTLLAVDPEKDHIYRSPPGFLELEKVEAPLPALTVTAFSAIKTKFLQLDPPGQVKKGDFLRIEQGLGQTSGVRDCTPIGNQEEARAIDHLVVSDVKGPIVTVSEPLPRDYVEGTQVQKATRFELFEGKNWQEHILYLAHNEYFAIKSEAQITLRVEHAPGTSSNLQAFNVVWEFFGVMETDPKEEGWHEFQVDVDGTQGLSRNGEVVLIKPAGEIKEQEINGNKSRWIRARLKDSLPATPPRQLPKIESITFVVTSGGKDLPPDQAFHNDTPLTTAVDFFPFGTEPRIFDRFSIASEEAFSKTGAEIDLNFTLDNTDLLASPAAVVAQNKIRVFARAAAGKLLEFQIDPVTSNLVVEKHGSPKETRISAGSTPAVVTDIDERFVGVFVKTDDGKIHMRHMSALISTGQSWKLLGGIPGTLQFNPTAIQLGGSWVIYVVADNRLYYQIREAADPNAERSWDPISGGPKVDSSPVALHDGILTAFVTDVNGNTWMFRIFWNDLTPQLSPGVPDPVFLAAKNARPFARPYTGGLGFTQQFRVYVRNRSNELVALDTVSGSISNLGAPEGGVGSNPFGASWPADDRIYVRGLKDNHLWSIKDSPGEVWIDHETSGAINLDGDPFVITYPKQTANFVSAFSTSRKNALLEFRASGANVAAGNIQAGPYDIVLLEKLPQAAGTYYIHILSGPGANSSADAVRKIKQQLTSGKFAVLESPLDESATTETEYELLREEADGQVQDATATTLELEVGGGDDVEDDDYIFVRNQLRRIPVAPASGDVVTIETPWDTLPTSSDNYLLLRVDEDTEGDGADGVSALRAVLDPSVQQPDDTYNQKFLQITSGPGASPVGRRINDYFEDTNNVVLATKFLEPPTSDSTFAITVSSIPEAWYVHKDPDQAELRPELSWEYWNGRGWVALVVEKDETEKLLIEGSIRFKLPANIAKTEVAGQENFWLRARIVGGDYGRELFTFDQTTGNITVEKDPIRPPLVKKLSITYKLIEQKLPQVCLTFNNMNYLDQTAANDTDDKHFNPFIPLSDTGKAVYFGFDRAFEGGPVRLYFATKELEVDERDKPKLNWELAFDNDWKNLLAAADDTEAFTKPEFVSLALPQGFQNRQQFGQALYWLRATLTEGSWTKSPLLEGVFINTVETMQARTISDEILGSSTGVKNQLFRFQQLPVIEGEEVRVREVLTDQEREQLIAARGEEAVLSFRDQQGRVLETWIRWTEVQEFFASESDSRHYRLDRATGEIEFGDGVRGRIPPAGGDNIKAFTYQAGGGAGGNVAPGEINSAVTAVSGVDSVNNPVGGGGGSEAATNDDMLEIGPEQISNRGRAVTCADFEQLAREASRDVRKALCLPNRNPAGRHESGWTSVHIVPYSKDAKPMPSLELRRAVQRFLADRADVMLVDQKHIFVGAPEYVAVGVEVVVFARSLDSVSSAEQSVRKQLDQFLHPLTGGLDSEGWEFGRDLAASDLYSLLEDIAEVDHVGSLRLLFGDKESEERVEVGDNALIASGTHKIMMRVRVGE